MNLFENIVITDIEQPVVVHSEKGRHFQMTDRDSYGISFCISGQISYTMQGKIYISDPGCAVILPKGGTYTLHGDKEGLFPVVNFQCERFDVKEILTIPLPNPGICIKDFEALKGCFLNQDSRLRIYSIFYELLRKITAEPISEHRYLPAIGRLIEENLANPSLSNPMIAKQIGISEVYMRQLFQKHLHTSPKQYILEKRLQKAKQMLVDTPFAIGSIAEECGFSSVYHFCKVFKSKTGLTPTEYAEQNRYYQI